MPEVLHDTSVAVPREITADTKTGVLKVLAYFDIFQYPLKKSEIRQFLGSAAGDLVIEIALDQLLADKLVFFHHHFYSLQNDPASAYRRIHGNLRAAVLLPTAHKIGRFLYNFPFVRGVGVSGSLSKNFADEKADIDFFVITKANRLWIARTLMHLFKKFAFITGRQHFYCMNYYLDEEALLLQEQNIFTAVEIKTLFPVSGNKATEQFFQANQWTNEWLPCCEFRKQPAPDPAATLFKRFVEWLCDNRAGEAMDNYLMRLTGKRWKRKETKGMRNQKGRKMGLTTGKHFARSNPGAFQEEVLRLYRERLDRLNIGETWR